MRFSADTAMLSTTPVSWQLRAALSERERESTGLIYCLCRGESEKGGVKSEILSLSLWSWVRQVGVWAERRRNPTEWRGADFSPSSSAGDFPQTFLLLHILCVQPILLSLSWEPVIDLIWPLLNKSLSGITQHASQSAESCALMLFGWWRERNPAVLLSPVWVQTQPWESQDSLCAALFLYACLPREFA